MDRNTRKAGKDLNVKVPELGAQSESDINDQISILENAVFEKPAAIVISPTQKAALGKPIDEAAKKVKIIGIDSAADFKAFTSFLTADNVQGGRIVADGLGEVIKAKYGKARRGHRADHRNSRCWFTGRAHPGLQRGDRGQISGPEASR